MSRFIDALAKTFADVPDLGDYFFLFPTRRAGRFFIDALGERVSDSTLLPRVDTLGHWVERCSNSALVGDQEPVFILYEAYCRLLEDRKGEEWVRPKFEQFRHWGAMLAADFQDIDRNLVDAETVFTNVKSLKNISTDYLTKEQKAIIEKFWGKDALNNLAAPPEAVERFWKSSTNDKSVSGKYLRLWQVLPQLYRALHDALNKTHTATQGMMLREVARDLDPEKLLPRMGIKKLVFAGFDNLSLAEIEIMLKLQKADAAYFYWDIPPLLKKISPNLGTPMIEQFAQQFPEPDDLRLEADDEHPMPAVEIVGVPGHHAQTRAAAVGLSQWAEDPDVIPNVSNAIDTAIVLPEADLFLPMIHAVPKEFEKINVTMGVPMRQTPVGTLMQQVVRLQTRARRKSDNPHDVSYFYEDVKVLLANPLVRSYANDEADRLLRYISDKHLLRISSTILDELDLDRLRPLFRDPETDTALQADPEGAVYAYIFGITEFIRKADEQNEKGRHKLTELFVDTYRDATKQLCANLAGHGITLSNNTMLKMVQQSMMSYEVPLSGKPIEGLQIMGVRETQSLDFGNLMVLSMNENVFPQKAYRRSLIPDLLRRAFGMSTSQQVDQVMAYRFFRLVAHANRVSLFYDTRADSLRNPRMSRYIYQLIYMPGAEKPRHITMQFPLNSSPKRTLAVKRDDSVRQKLSAFTNGGDKGLSPSAIKTYLACPLHFYLSYVEGINLDDELTDSIDAAMFGTILHAAFEQLYKGLKGPITADRLNALAEDREKIDRCLKEAYNAKFRHLQNEKLGEDLPPSAEILLAVMRKMIVNTLKAEAEVAVGTPFTVIGNEVNLRKEWDLVPGHPINFKGFIDRLDKLTDDTLRMVDYKTGADDLTAPDIQTLFSNEKKGAILQLLMYAHLYNVGEDHKYHVNPVVYKLRDPKPGSKPIKINRQEVTDHTEYSAEFLELMRKTLSEIFDFNGEDTEGFRMSDDPNACRYCKMRVLCQTTPPKW